MQYIHGMTAVHTTSLNFLQYMTIYRFLVCLVQKMQEQMTHTSRSDTKTIIPGIMMIEHNTSTAKGGSPPVEKVTTSQQNFEQLQAL